MVSYFVSGFSIPPDAQILHWPQILTILRQVKILVDDGLGSDVVEADIVGTVTTTATLYDPNLSTASGCDPAGCTASLTGVS